MNPREKTIQNARLNNLLGLCDAAKKIDYKNEQTIRDFYFYCLRERNTGNYYALDKFKEWFPSTFTRLQSTLNKRTIIKNDIKTLQSFKRGLVVFGALTFSDSNYKDNEKNMRIKAQRYLERYMPIYELIEEYGEDKGRYHIHFLGILKEGITYLEFHAGWEDYSYIERVKDHKKDLKKVSKYLCDYIVKQVPRIRRNKRFIKVKDLQLKLDRASSEEDKNYYKLEIEKQFIDESDDLPF